MSAPSKRRFTTWAPVIVACALGCATETQGDGVAPGQLGESGSGGSAAGSATDAGSGGMMTGGAGTNGTAGSGGTNATGGTFTNGGTFATAGFMNGGTFSEAGTTTGGASTGGGGAGGSGGAAAGSGGKGGSGGAGGAAAGAGGKGGSGGTSGGSGGSGGAQGGGTCKTGKLFPAAATDGGNPEYPPSNAIDGMANTRWGSVHMDDTAYLQLDMGEAVTVNRVSILWENAYATDYKIQIADNAAGPFTDLYEDKAGTGGTDDVMAPTLKVGRGRYVRMQGVTRKLQGYGYSIYEMEVYGDADETCK